MVAKVFISYRHVDSAGSAGRVRDRLARESGRDLVFMDVDSIPLGANLIEYIGNEVANCGVLLAVIGPNWLNARLNNPNDFVRIEIAAALRQRIPVIPILIDDATIPHQLPDELKELSLCNGLRVRNEAFDRDMEWLIEHLKGLSGSLESCIRELRNCIRELRTFDPNGENIPRAEALEALVDDALSKAFGHGTSRYNFYREAANLNTEEAKSKLRARKKGFNKLTIKGSKVLTLSDDLAEGKERSIQLLEQAVSTLEGAIPRHKTDREPTSP
jgi:TIR domain